jgi:hypothetical protein
MTEMPPEQADGSSESAGAEEAGPWPFVTRRVYVLTDGSTQTWSSRHHRKGLLVRGVAEGERLGSILLRCLWMPGQLNWWIGIIFALGSLLFALASVLSLTPPLAQALSLDSLEINAIFFAGSIPFTTAGYLQLYQAANAGGKKGSGLFSRNGLKGASQKRGLTPFSPPQAPQRRAIFGWRPHDIGWLSSALQFIGTVLFNFNTFDAMIPSLNWFQQDLVIWSPNIIGSILFLASGYLAFIETCHAYWAWKPKSISWWVVFTNLLGCVGFMMSALLAIVLPGTPNIEVVHISVLFTLLGAIGFLVGSLLMLPETIAAEQQQ